MLMETDNRCVACGAIIPEGRQICLNCEHSIQTDIIDELVEMVLYYARMRENAEELEKPWEP